MHELLDILSRWIGPEHLVGKILGLLASLVAAEEVLRRVYPSLRKYAAIKLRRWKIDQLDEVAQTLLDSEQKYLASFLDVVRLRSKNWTPSRFVQPGLDVREKTFEPIDPILVFLDSMAGQQPMTDLPLEERKERFKRERIHDLFSALRALKSLVILGDPGSGKTTCLLQLGTEVANRALMSSNLTPLLPIFLPLNEFTDPLPSGRTNEGILKFIREQLTQQASETGVPTADIGGRLQTLIRDGRVVFLFDALDEMPRVGYDERFKALGRFVKYCSAQNDHNLFLFTCRRLDFADIPAQQITLSPFSDHQIRQFFKRHLPGDGSTAYRDFVKTGQDLMIYARSPFFLGLVTTCVEAQVQPGATWDVLIANWVQVSFEKERKRGGYEESDWQEIESKIMRWPTELAFEVTLSAATGTKADPSLVSRSLAEYQDPGQLLEIAASCHILRRIGSLGAVRFEHHRLQEYFAAVKLAHLFDAGEVDVYEYLDDIWWRGVILMTSGIMNHPDDLINQILDAAQDMEFAHFSEISGEFSRVMTAMSCFRPASHRITANTSRRLINYLVQFLRHGNVLQKVRCLRIVPQIQDVKVLNEAKQLLRDKSKWVRETALSALAESTILAPRFGSVLKQRLVQMTRTEELLLQGIQDFPILLQHRQTRWYVPLYFIFGIAGILKATGVWLVFCTFLSWSLYQKRISASDFALWCCAPIAGYALARTLLRRRFSIRWRLNMAESFNRWTIFVVLWGAAAYLVTTGLENLGRVSGSVGNIGVGLVNWVLFLIVYYFFWTRRLAVYVEWRRRRRERWFDLSSLKPDENLEGRKLQALRIVHAAKQERDPHSREQLLDVIKVLLPLANSSLLAVEEFAESELDLNVRTRAYQVYEQIELSIEREESARRLHREAEG